MYSDNEDLTEEYIYGKTGWLNSPAFSGASRKFKLEHRDLLLHSPENIAARELQFLKARSHSLVRNDGWGAAAYEHFKTHYKAPTVQWQDAKKEIHKGVQEKWDEFAADPSIDGYGNLESHINTWKAEFFIKGEAFSRMLVQKRPNKGVPLYLQEINANHVDPSYMGLSINDNIRNSIRFDSFNRPIGYFISPYPLTMENMTIQRTEINAKDVIHIFERKEANQWRGYPALTSVITALYDITDLTDATIAKQKAAQAIAWIIKNSNPTSMLAVGKVSQVSESGNGKRNFGKKQTITTANGGGTFYLEKGEDVTFYQGTDIGPNLANLLKTELHKISQNLGATYETLTGDLTGLSFSAIKYILLSLQQRIEFTMQNYFITLGLIKVTTRFKELLLLDSSRTWKNVTPKIQLARFPGIDEFKETQKDVLELMHGIADIDEVLAARGVSKEESQKTISWLKDLGIFTTDRTSMAQANNTSANTNTSEV